MFSNIDKNYIDKSEKQQKFTNRQERIRKMGKLKDNKIAYYSFLVSILLTIYFCITFIGGSIGFIFKFPIYGFEFVLFPVIGMFIFVVILKQEREKYYWLIPLITLAVYFALCFLLIYINIGIWDMSSDSLGYHEPMILALDNGWNPITNNTFNNSLNIWDIHYPRANAIYATMIYQLTGNIESGKILSSLIPIISSFWGFSFIVAMCKNKKKKIAILLGILGGLLILVNPINIEQSLTFYVDSSLGGMIIITIIMMFYIIFFEDLIGLKFKSLIFIIAFTTNVKFTGLIYSMGLIAGIFVFFLFYGNKNEIKKAFSFFFWTFIFSVCVVGFDPYITNIITNHNPFYPLMGSGAVNIMTPNTPVDLLGKTNFVQYLDSLVANISSGINSTGQVAHYVSQLMQVNKNVFEYYALPDPRLRGLGILSFIIEPMSFVLFVVLIIQMLKSGINKFFVAIVLILAGVTIIFTLYAGGYWWARYMPFYWILPTLLVIGLLGRKGIILKLIGVVFLIFLIVNTVFFIPTFKYKIQNSNTFKEMIFNNNGIIVNGSFGQEVFETKLNEFKIPYKVQK